MPQSPRREQAFRPAKTAPGPLVLAQKPAPATPTVLAQEAAADPPGAPPIQAKPTRAERKARAKASKSGAAASWPWLDVAAGASLSVIAAITSTTPPGPLRMAIGLTMVLFVPGYLLLQAFAVPAATGKRRGWQALASLGISPAVVGVFALTTSVVQGGFRLDAILIVNTVACLGLAAAALVRRRALAHAADPKAAEMPQAATAKSGPVRP